MTDGDKFPKQLALLKLVGAHKHVLPGISRQILVKEEDGIKALEQVRASDYMVTLTAAVLRSKTAGPKPIGCIVRLIQDIKLHDGSHQVILEGKARCRVIASLANIEFPTLVKHEDLPAIGIPSKNAALAILRTIHRLLDKLEKAGLTALTADAIRNVRTMEDIAKCIDYLALSLTGRDDDAFCQEFLEMVNVEKRSLLIISLLARRLEEGKIERKIRRRVKKQMEKTHQEFHLSEQAKAIQDELEGDGNSELDELRRKIDECGMPEAAGDKCKTELERLASIPQASPESSVLRTYIETLVSLPWQERSKAKLDMHNAQEVLNEDHYGLTKVKDRIMEYLAVQRRIGKQGGSVLCFAGPPGVGKTSLGRSIARATGREFVRVSLGGVHEEAAIRGHRRTYVASMPGRILKAMIKAKVRNPVFMLDEFDKVARGIGFHGDPSAALLEVLDPEQNKSFVDQYVEVEFDLSDVMFITTANTVEHMPDALYDRLEIIDLPGYTDTEKLEIAKRHLIAKQVRDHGLASNDVVFSDKIIMDIIREYTHEAGVRNLDRSLAKICRKIATEQVIAKSGATKHRSMRVTKKRVAELLEVPEFYSTFNLPTRHRQGYVNGLIYGRGVCPMEAVVYSSNNSEVEVTGLTEGSDEITALHDVSLTLLKSRHAKLGLPANFADQITVHIHLQDRATTPYGALGASMYALLASVFTKIPVRSGTALLGEINLRGNVISSEFFSEYKATVMDAQRKKIKRIVMPHEDARLLAELPAELTRDIEFILVRDVDEVLKHALARLPTPIAKTTSPLALKRKLVPDVATTTH